MKKQYNLMLVILLTSARTSLSQGQNPNTNINSTPSPSITNTPINSPKETVLPSNIVTNPTPIASPILEKTIKKVEIYNRRNNFLLKAFEEPRINNPNETYSFELSDNYYYDLEVKVIYSDNSVNSDFILKSSNELIANIDNTGRVFTHSVENNRLFSIILLDKNTKNEVYSIKVAATTGFQNYKIKTVGTIYDTENNIVKGTNVSVINLDLPDATKDIFVDQPIDGTYTLRFAPVASKLELIVSKEGYKTQKRYFIIKGDPEVETFNFGGSNPEDKQYALEKI